MLPPHLKNKSRFSRIIELGFSKQKHYVRKLMYKTECLFKSRKTI